jgi:hypothetical protein
LPVAHRDDFSDRGVSGGAATADSAGVAGLLGSPVDWPSAVYPGRPCFPGEAPAPYLRLSYAGEQAPALRRAAAILGDLIERR